jgi:hypothetical protein
MVCMIFIVHTMHDCWAQLKMGLPPAYVLPARQRSFITVSIVPLVHTVLAC